MRILNVIDTRAYEEVGDTFKPIPGSGNMRPCDRCGRIHEIHVQVQTDKGISVVGLGCANQESMVTEAQYKSTGSCAKTIARLEAMIAKEQARIARYNAALLQGTESYKRIRPAITEHPFRFGTRRDLKHYKMDDVQETAERLGGDVKERLRIAWIINRAKESLGVSWIGAYMLYTDGRIEASQATLNDYKERLQKAQAKMVRLTTERS